MARRILGRLSKIEQQQPGATATRADRALLVTILARRDALFWPWRYRGVREPPLSELRARQRDYLAGNVGITVKADGRAQWKDAHKMRQNLITAGHITATHSGGQVQSVFLTPLGEATARALVGDRLHTVEQSLMVFAYLLLKSKETACNVVRESVLFGQPCIGNPQDWQDCTEMVLPLLTSGMVDCTTDTQGRACYAPVDPPPPDYPHVTVDVDADDELATLYLKTFDSERTTLERVEPRDPHEVHIPLPASGWGLHYTEAVDDDKKE